MLYGMLNIARINSHILWKKNRVKLNKKKEEELKKLTSSVPQSSRRKSSTSSAPSTDSTLDSAKFLNRKEYLRRISIRMLLPNWKQRLGERIQQNILKEKIHNVIALEEGQPNLPEVPSSKHKKRNSDPSKDCVEPEDRVEPKDRVRQKDRSRSVSAGRTRRKCELCYEAEKTHGF